MPFSTVTADAVPKIKFNAFLFKMIIFYNLISYVYCALLRFTVTYNKVCCSTVQHNIIKAVHLLMHQYLYYSHTSASKLSKNLEFSPVCSCKHVPAQNAKEQKNKSGNFRWTNPTTSPPQLLMWSLCVQPTTSSNNLCDVLPGITVLLFFCICILMGRESQRLHRHASPAGRNLTSWPTTARPSCCQFSKARSMSPSFA